MQEHLRERFRKKVDYRDRAAVQREDTICFMNQVLEAHGSPMDLRMRLWPYVDFAVVNLPPPAPGR